MTPSLPPPVQTSPLAPAPPPAHAGPAAAAAPSRSSLWAEQEMLVLREAVRLLGRSLRAGPAVREILHLSSELLGLNRGRVLLWDATARSLDVRWAYGLTEAQMALGRFAAGEGICGHVMLTGATQVVQDVDAEPRFLFRTVPRSALPAETVMFIALPVRQEGRIVGVLGVHRLRRRDRGLAEDLRLLDILTTLVGQLLALERRVEVRTAALQRENLALRAELDRTQSATAEVARAGGIVGQAPALQVALRQLGLVADSNATVLLLGESGTGKELAARAVHRLSPRRAGPFVQLNCAALPEPLFEAELFGHDKGAFTGATAARAGRFEQAHGGTLFLDEIGELPLSLQAKLLRVLQERVVERLGSHRERPVDVRVVAATHQDLQGLVASGRFRLDLFYRLHVLPVRLPALRERPEDLPLLAAHFLQQLNRQHGRRLRLSAAALQALAGHPWPGNVRQLHNVLERVVLLSGNGRRAPTAAGAAGAAGATDAVGDAGGDTVDHNDHGAHTDETDDLASPSDTDVERAVHLALSQEALAVPPAFATAASQPLAVQASPASTVGAWGESGAAASATGRAGAGTVPSEPSTVAPAPSPASQTPPPPSADAPRRYHWVKPDDRERLRAALQASGGNQAAAARALGLSVRQLRYRLQVLGLVASGSVG